jgi:hypothetical protein
LSLKRKNRASILGRVEARLVLKQSGLTKNKTGKIKQNRRIKTMKTKKMRKGGSHIKVQGLRNGEMRAAKGGKEWTCGDSAGDDCKKIRVVVSAQADLLSIYVSQAGESY